MQSVILLSPPPLTKASTAPSPRTPEVTWRHARTRHGGGSAAHPAHKFNGSRYPGRTVTTPLSHWLAARELASHWLPPTQFPPMTQQLPNYLKNARWKVRRSLVVLFRSFGQPRSVNMPWTWTHSLWDTGPALSFSGDCLLPKPVEERKGRFFWLKLELVELKLESLVIEDVMFHHIFWIPPLVSFILRTFFLLLPKSTSRVSGGKIRFKPTSEQNTQDNLANTE